MAPANPTATTVAKLRAATAGKASTDIAAKLVISHHTDVLERADLVCFVSGDGSCLVGTATELAQRSRRFSAMVSVDGVDTARREAGDSDRLVQTLPSS